MIPRLRGIFPPVPTPFRDGRLDESRLAANARRWLTRGVAGLVVLGSSGEAVLLDDNESERAIATAREAVPAGRLLIAGIGRESTAATIDAAKRARSAGADVVLARTPSFFKREMTSDAFVQHYGAVADESPAPVLLYNVTVFTGVNLLPEAVARLAEHPNIVGIKESGGDIEQIIELVSLTPPGFAVLAGSATTFHAALCAGACGGILALACVVPELCVRLCALAEEGRDEEARVLQQQVNPLARLVTTIHGIAGLKAAVELAGYPSGEPRSPLLPASAEAVREISAALTNLARSLHTQASGTSL